MFGEASVFFSLALFSSSVALAVQCQPLEHDIAPLAPPASLNRQKRITLNFEQLFGASEWPRFRKALRMPALSTFNLPSVSDFFDDGEAHDSLSRRITNLENRQKCILDFLLKLQADSLSNPCKTEEQTEAAATQESSENSATKPPSKNANTADESKPAKSTAEIDRETTTGVYDDEIANEMFV